MSWIRPTKSGRETRPSTRDRGAVAALVGKPEAVDDPALADRLRVAETFVGDGDRELGAELRGILECQRRDRAQTLEARVRSLHAAASGHAFILIICRLCEREAVAGREIAHVTQQRIHRFRIVVDAMHLVVVARVAAVAAVFELEVAVGGAVGDRRRRELVGFSVRGRREQLRGFERAVGERAGELAPLGPSRHHVDHARGAGGAERERDEAAKHLDALDRVDGQIGEIDDAAARAREAHAVEQDLDLTAAGAAHDGRREILAPAEVAHVNAGRAFQQLAHRGAAAPSIAGVDHLDESGRVLAALERARRSFADGDHRRCRHRRLAGMSRRRAERAKEGKR